TTKPGRSDSGAGADTTAAVRVATGFWATAALPPVRGSAIAVLGASAPGNATPWRRLILPPPGGGPYLATISGGAMIAPLPRISVVIVRGTLSSSTQMYSGSLRTSPKRGLLIRSQRGSADLSSMVGLPGPWMPRTLRTEVQPDTATTTSNQTTRAFMRRLP